MKRNFSGRGPEEVYSRKHQKIILEPEVDNKLLDQVDPETIVPTEETEFQVQMREVWIEGRHHQNPPMRLERR